MEMEKRRPMQETDVEQIRLDCERDNFMTAAQAKEYGLIDQVLEND